MATNQVAPANGNEHSPLKALLEDVSFDDLVFFKLKRFIDRLDIESENNLLELIMARVEQPLIRLVLEKCDHNKSKAAKVLGVNRATLTKMLERTTD